MKRAVISITDSCNLNCRHCYNKVSNKNTTQDFIDEKFVIQLQRLGIQQIVLSGGEPSYDWELLLSIINILHNRFSLVITSNGILLNEDKIHILSKLGISRLQISLDGANAGTHEYLRGKGTYQHSFDLVKTFPSFITPMFTIHAQNYNEIEDFIHQQIDNGVNKIGFERFIPIKGNLNNNELSLTKEQLYFAYEILSNHNDIEFHINDPLYNIYLFIKNKIPLDLSLTNFCFGCQAGENNIYINASGDVFPCVFSVEKIFNVHNTPLSYCKEYTHPIIKGCISCKYYRICKGCRAAAYHHFGDWLEKDPLCPLH